MTLQMWEKKEDWRQKYKAFKANAQEKEDLLIETKANEIILFERTRMIALTPLQHNKCGHKRVFVKKCAL